MTLAAETFARRVAAEVVQSISDSLPDDDTTDAQELLRGTPYESMFVLHGAVIEQHVTSVLEAELYELAAGTAVGAGGGSDGA